MLILYRIVRFACNRERERYQFKLDYGKHHTLRISPLCNWNKFDQRAILRLYALRLNQYGNEDFAGCPAGLKQMPA